MSPFLTVTIRDGAEKYGEAIWLNISPYTSRIPLECGSSQTILNDYPFKTLTVHFQLHHFADAGADAVLRLAHIEALTVLLDMLQQQRTVGQQLGVRTFANLLVVAGFASCVGVRVRDGFGGNAM